jgi:hypothetical protein
MRQRWFSFRINIILMTSFMIFLRYYYLRRHYEWISYPVLWTMNDDLINSSKTVNAQRIFLTDKGHWNIPLNSFLHMKLEAEVTPDINYFVRNNAEYLREVLGLQLPKYEQAKYWGSMSSVGFKMHISANKTLLLIFSRVWFSKNICHHACNPDKSYLYVEALTSSYHRTYYNLSSKNKKNIRIPSILEVTQPEINACCLGPEDSRIVLNDNNDLLFTFNMLDQDKRRKIWLYNLFTGYQTPLSIGNRPPLDMEKNWTPFVKNNKLHFVYSYKPLQILQCPTENGECEFISEVHTGQDIGSLRGGTQLVKFRDTDYFVGIARTTVSCSKCTRFYRPHIVVLSTISERFHLVYVSEPLMLDNIPLFASFSMSQKKNLPDFCYGIIRIMTPGSIINWEWANDKIFFTISVNDKRSFIVSIIGIGKLIERIISAVDNEYSQVVFDNSIGIKMVSYSESTALDYCKSVSETNKQNWRKP